MNLDLAKRIKALRAQKGFSQEELANETNLSIRTIQRIEGGETEARGDTLKRLANVLDVTPNDLVTWIEHEDRGYIAFLNLSAMSYIAFPLLNVIVPLALWILKRDKIKDMNEIGKRLINFQITWCILIGFFYVSFMVIKIFHVDVRIPHFGLRTFMNIGITDLIIIGIPILLYTYNFFLIIINTIRSYSDRSTFYQPAIRFLK